MLTPVSISPVRKLNIKIIKAKKPANFRSCFDIKNTNFSFGLDKSIYFKSNLKIFEKSNPLTFEKTIENNYFQLPSIELKNGSTFQFKPDESQIECAKKIYNGDSVVYCAPTGTGKTAVAHYAITKNLNEGKKTIYTTPLKALANDKMREFQKIYGKENVGLLTGDIKINTDAPIQIMTTEIYNNQVSTSPDKIKDVGTIIYDEAHYLGNEERGNVWENSIINTPIDKIQILCLSATIGNADELTSWIASLNGMRNVSKVEIDRKERFVPLVYSIYTPKYALNIKDKFTLLTDGKIVFNNQDDEFLNNKRLKRALEIFIKATKNIDNYTEISREEYIETYNELKTKFKDKEEYSINDFRETIKANYPNLSDEKILEITEFLISDKHLSKHYSGDFKENYPQFVEDLKDNNMLPAIIFKLSRQSAEDIIKDLKESKCDLTTENEKQEIKEILDKYKKQGIYLGINFDRVSLMRGFAYHHAGELPQCRKLIEELFSKKLIKVVSATSTLSAGINMPAKTVVITNTAFKRYNPLTDEVEYVNLTANDFAQMAGRAGRRGIDEIGHVVLYNLHSDGDNTENKDAKTNNLTLGDIRPNELDIAYSLLLKTPDNLSSKYKPDWSTIVDYFKNNPKTSNLNNVLNRSFKVYLASDKEKELRKLTSKFDSYKSVLLKLGFLEKGKDKEIKVTPKGKILSMCRGLNPLMLATLIYDKKLEGLDYKQLCQVIGYTITPSNQAEDILMEELSKLRAEILLEDSPNYKQDCLKYQRSEDSYIDTEEKISKILKENHLSLENLPLKDSYSGFISYMWSHLNSESTKSIDNFRLISGTVKNSLPDDKRFNRFFNLGNIRNEFKRKSNEGNIYDVLSQTVTILKQIDGICEYAICNPDEYPDSSYWRKLKETAELALISTQQEPIGDELMI